MFQQDLSVKCVSGLVGLKKNKKRRVFFKYQKQVRNVLSRNIKAAHKEYKEEGQCAQRGGGC